MHVLYIEDDPVDADLLRRHFHRGSASIELEIVGTLAAGIERLREPRDLDLVLADLRLPDGTGLEALAHVLDRELPLPVVIVTGAGDERVAVAALKAGAVDYVVKQANYFQTLPDRLRTALERYRARPKARALRVLYLEHDPVDVDLIRRDLAQNAPHIRIEHVGSVDELLGRLTDAAPGAHPVHVLLLDFRMPGLDGLEVAGRIRRERLAVAPIVMITGQGDEETAARALRDGIADYVIKGPGLQRELPAVLEKVDREWRHMREQVVLRATSARLSHLVATSPTILYELGIEDQRLVPRWVSTNITTILGYSEAEALEPGWWKDNLHPDDRETAVATARQLLGRERIVHEYRFFDCQGGVHWIRDELRMVEVPGLPPTITGSWSDITEQRLTAQQLRLNETLFNSTRDSVVVTDADGTIVGVNPAFTTISGYAPEEVVGDRPSVLRSGRHDADFYEAMWSKLTTDGFWQGEVWNRRRDGELYPQALSIGAVRDEDGAVTHYVGVGTDRSALHRTEQEREHLAHYDPLTGLPNRLYFRAQLGEAIDDAAQRGDRVALLLVNLDDFKTVNQSLGFAGGDELLRTVVARLEKHCAAGATIGRLGGDEFGVALAGRIEPEDAASAAEAVLRMLDEPFAAAGGEIFLRTSVGVGLYPEDGATAGELLRGADAAIKVAKEHGGRCLRFYTEELGRRAQERLALESALRRALFDEEFALYYQPVLDVAAGRLAGAEALIRWPRPGGSPVPPDRFLPTAEGCGLMGAIGAWVIREACRQAAAWRTEGREFGRIAINLTAADIMEPDIVDRVRRTLDEYDLPARCLEVEITETGLIEDSQLSMAVLRGLRALGVGLAIDDFGTGYSSLGYLQRFAVDKLKIDRSFVTGLPGAEQSAKITRAVVALAASIGLRTVAEGVETREQLEFLRHAGCDAYQGYLESEPLPAHEFAERYLRPADNRREGPGIDAKNTPG